MKPTTEKAKAAGCTCTILELPSKNHPYPIKKFIAYQPDCPVRGHGIFKRAGADRRRSLPTSFKVENSTSVNINLGNLLG